jgi:fibronectin-binding autotransporter adhesin
MTKTFQTICRLRIEATGLAIAFFLVCATSEGQVTFNPAIVSSQSTLTAAMTFNGATATAQVPGSLSDTYSGSLLASLNGNTLTFSGGSQIVALAAPTGYQPPLGGANTEGSPQNYGAYFSNVSVVVFSFSSDADVRELTMDVTGGSVAVGSAASGLTFTALSGATNYSVPPGAIPGYSGYYSQNFSGTSAVNSSTAPVTLTASGSTETLTIPVSLTYSFSFDVSVGSSEFEYPGSINVTGSLVATALAPSSGTWTAAGNGSWANAINWSSYPAVPTSGGTATFAGAPSAPIKVTLDGNQAVAGLAFDVASTNGYTLSKGTGGVLTLGSSSSGGLISVISGSDAIQAPVLLGGDLLVNGGGTLTFGNSSSIADGGHGYTLTMNGAGGLMILSGADTYTGGTIVSAGDLELTTPNAIESGSSLVVGQNASSIFAPAFGQLTSASPPTGVAAVPEPGAISLLAVSALLVAFRASRRPKKTTLV